MTDLLDKLNLNVNSLIDYCPSIFTTSQYDTTLGIVDRDTIDLNIAPTDDQLKILQQEYFKVVEEGNGYIAKLEAAEKDFFEKKYGTNIYNYLKEQRNEHSNTTAADSDDNSNLSYGHLKQALQDEWDLYKDLSNVSTAGLASVNCSETDRDDLDRRQIYYRNTVTSDVLNTSNYVTYVYYFIVVMFMLFLYSNDVLHLYKNKFLYAFILGFPFLYRYIFSSIILFYNEMYKFLHNRGSKNAFLNSKEPFFFEDQLNAGS